MVDAAANEPDVPAPLAALRENVSGLGATGGGKFTLNTVPALAGIARLPTPSMTTAPIALFKFSTPISLNETARQNRTTQNEQTRSSHDWHLAEPRLPDGGAARAADSRAAVFRLRTGAVRAPS